MRRIKFLTTYVLFAALMSVGLRAQASADTDVGEILWQTYTDPRYDYSLEYPADWTIIPRDDRENSHSGVLTFTDKASETQIVIGFYLLERDSSQSLAEWTDRYQRQSSIFEPSEVTIEKAELVQSFAGDHGEAFTVRGVSPLTQFQFTNIPRGRIVWFIWSDAVDDAASIYNHMVSSFQFGKDSPQTLKDAYGVEFQARTSLPTAKQLAGLVTLTSDPAGYRLPFTGQKTITNGPGCGSTHTGSSSEAIDYSMAVGTPVKATYDGFVVSAGWNNEGYGNMVQIYHSSGSRYSWYAHLQSIVTYYVSVGKGQLIAYSGNTGNSSGPHLHFEVRTNNQSIWIRTLPTTVWYSGDPNNPCQPAGQDDGYATGP